MPPLRDRREDLGLLIGALLPRLLGASAATTTLSLDAGHALLGYGWPANVRELEQCLARAAALAAPGPIELRHLPEAVLRRASSAPEPGTLAPLSDADERLRAQLVDELRQHGGNVSEVARAMGKARMQIQRWMKRFRIDATTFRS